MSDQPAAAPRNLFLFTREHYERLVELGAFEGERVELLDGLLVRMSPQGSWHIAVASRLHRLVLASLGDLVDVTCHSPVALKASEPEPDLAVYPRGHVTTRAVPSAPLWIVEVSDTSETSDRTDKAKLYARNAVPEYWVVSRAAEGIEVYTQPDTEAEEYRSRAFYPKGRELSPAAFPELVIRVSEIALDD